MSKLFVFVAVIGSLFFVQSCVALDNGVALRPPMGWNTWCTDDYCGLVDYCNETLIKRMADAMASNGMKELGYEYINMDDCWSATERDAQGNIQADPLNFPSGMKALADYIHSKGLKFGLYLCAGTKTCKRNRPGSWGHFKEDAIQVAKWGMDFVKMDWCHHPQLPPNEVYGEFRDALNATGAKILFSICEWGEDTPWKWGPTTGNMWRMHPDHLPLWGSPSGTADIIQTWATPGLANASSPGSWNDPDFLMTGLFPFTDAESRTEFAFWSLWAAPLIVATDISNMTPLKKQILLNDEIIAVNQDKLYISGDLKVNNSDGSQIWTKPLVNHEFAVILYNSQVHIEAPVLDITLDFGALGLPSGMRAHVRDLWSHQDLGVYTNGFTGHGIAPHAHQMILVSPISP